MGESCEKRKEIWMGLKEGMWQKTARIEGLWKCSVETWYSRNFLQYVKVILKKSPNNERSRTSIDISCHQIKLPVLVLRWKFPNNPDDSQDNRFLFARGHQGPIVYVNTHTIH